MSARERFFAWLGAVERWLRWRVLAIGAAALAAALLAVTAAGAWLGLRYAFDPQVLLAARMALIVGGGSVLALAAAAVLAINRRRAARLAEQKLAGLDERAATLSGAAAGSPLAELVAEEALRIAEAVPPRQIAGSAILAGASAAATAALLVLVWLVAAAPGTLGYGARLLWAGTPPPGQQPLFQLIVKPGDAKVRRGGDQLIEALTAGLDTSGLQLRLRRAGSAQWETLPMEPNPSGPGHVFLLAGVTEDVEYQVDARRLRSPVYRLSVVDLPRVEKIRVRYRYPAWLGLPEKVEDPGGDIRAVEGTVAELEILTDRPLDRGVLLLDDGTRLKLSPAGDRRLRAELEVRRDGAYHVAALEGGEPVRLTEDYFIEAQPERAPEVRLTRPGRDARVSPIEEVVIEAEAADDFGLRSLEITFSVNGGEPRSIPLPVRAGAKEARGRTLLALEEFRLQPGDIVAVAATARDARAAAQTDIFFLEAQPFEREFQQSQTMGGGAGMEGEDEDADIVQRQKEIIAATWNQIRSPKPRAQAQEDAVFLSGVQEKLSAQARSLAQRMRSRQLAAMSEESRRFAELMTEASKAMQEASGRLRSLAWRDALAPEQRALQNLLRAESLFRQIQVAFGLQGGGRGSGGGQLRDLESLFELELDLEKNQYETVQTASGSASRERQIDEALRKLEELARRQQQAAEQQRRNEQSFQQRWQQEMLRREAEEVRRHLEELQRNQRGQSGQLSRNPQGSQSGQSADSSQASASASSGRAGGPQSERLSRARQELERAIEDMRRAQSAQGPQAQENARRAAERIQQALGELGQLRQRETGDRMEDLSRRASALAERQRRFEEQLRRLFPQADGSRPQQPGQAAGTGADAERLAREKESMQRDYQRLEQDLRETARALDGSQRGAASRLRQALGEAQQDEVALRLRLGAEWMRRGLGPYIAPRERVLTEALDRLSRQVEEARQMAGREGGDAREREQMERALGQIEQLRQQLEREARAARQGRQGQPGQDRGQQPGQGERASGQQGQQPGRTGNPAASGSPDGRRRQTGGETSFWRGDYGALNDGSLQPDWSRTGSAGSARGAWLDALRQLRELREQGAASDETREELDRLLRQMQRLDPARFGGPLLAERIERELLPQLEQLELKLRRDLGEKTAPPRAAAPSKAPPGYAEAVAEYFRRLSRAR